MKKIILFILFIASQPITFAQPFALKEYFDEIYAVEYGSFESDIPNSLSWVMAADNMYETTKDKAYLI